MSVCFSAASLVKDSCRRRQCAHKAVQQECLPGPGTSSKTAIWGQKEKDMKAWWGDGDKRGLVLQGIWPMWGDRCFCVEGRGERTHTVASVMAIPPWDEQTDVWRGCTGMPGLSEHIHTFSDDIFSSPFHPSEHHLLFISSSRLTFTIPLELLKWWPLMSFGPYFSHILRSWGRRKQPPKIICPPWEVFKYPMWLKPIQICKKHEL